MRSLEFDPHVFEDLGWWVEKDRKMTLKIINLIKEINRDPFRGQGNPEKLKHELSGSYAKH
ncbi:MAG: Txe/YoeB family addiction module toxin [Nitrospirae bacterium]|nr:Txe/YoeB family addiction module toxin [Nitrospirota bacterium]